jgi:YD repeat-containing protein
VLDVPERGRSGHTGQKGNLTSITPPVPLATTTITNDALSRVATVTDGKGQKRTYTYDKLDRVKRIDYNNSAGSLITSTTFTDAGGTVTYAYDSRNLPASLAEPGGACSGTVSKGTTFTYDGRGRHSTTIYPNGVTQTWGLG